MYALQCIAAEVCPHEAVANYLNIPDPAPHPPTGSDLELAQDGSPTQLLRVGMCPFWAMCSNKDSLGIPTSTGFNIHSYLPDNTPGVLENGENGIVPTALAIGLRESTASVPEANSFKATIVPVSVHEHSFDYWEQVKSEVIPWISAPIPSGGGTPLTDFNSDARPDLLLSNAATRQTVLWYMDNNIRIGSASGPTLPAGWTVAGVGDFNRDGHPDYVLFNSVSHATVIWYMNNNVYTTGAYGPTLPGGWSVAAVADFNGDGHPDFLLFNATTRATVIWYMNNNVHTTGAYGPTLPGGWSVAAVADFNGDGHPDFLLFNATTRATVIWYMNNNVHITGTTGPVLPAGWVVAGAADFNGDGHPDFLLFNATTRATVIWYMNNNVHTTGAYGPISRPAGAWSHPKLIFSLNCADPHRNPLCAISNGVTCMRRKSFPAGRLRLFAFAASGQQSLKLRLLTKPQHFTISRHASPRGGFLFHAASRFFEIARVLVRFDHVARFIVNTNHSIV